jgi:hypothetical protein
MVAAMGFVFAGNAYADRDPTEIVKDAYEDVLGREPDKDGLRNYRSRIIDDGWSEQDVRKALRQSDEYKSTKAKRIIENAYEDLLDRKPDKAGYDNYMNLIVNKGWSEERVRRSLRNSDEYKNKHR